MKKRFRIQIDFTIDSDEGMVQPDLRFQTSRSKEEVEADTALQRRLYQAVLSQPETLRAYLEYCIFSALETMGSGDWCEAFKKDTFDIEDILTPAVATLSNEDQQWFGGASENQVFFECTEEFQDGFIVTRDQITLIDLSGSEGQ